MPSENRRCVVVGPGRMGSALAGALRATGLAVDGPLGRGADAAGADLVLLCVPDGEIAAAAAAVTPREGLLVGHVSGATTLAPLAPHEAFSVHPLMTVAARGAEFRGAGAAVAGSTARALTAAEALATALGMEPFTVADEDRAAYHAGASMASNYLLTLLAAAERIAGAERRHLLGLVEATVANWASLGAQDALTGPVARGDEETVARQRNAVAARAPESLALFDALTDRTRALAATEVLA